MDAEMLGIVMAWKQVTTDSQGAIGRILELQFQPAKSWIEGRVQRDSQKQVGWIKGHAGVIGNEVADFRAKTAAIFGRLSNQCQIATPAGLREEFHMPKMTTQVRNWDAKVLRRLTYMVTGFLFYFFILKSIYTRMGLKVKPRTTKAQ